jgi:2-polyprenyl-6-methoxyphenol hydroxylase-like FAD-dependent oxidoreductase
MTDVDVLIAGAGPTGLVLACDLARRGVRVRLIERGPEAARGSRGFTLKPRSLEILDDLGVADSVLAAAETQGRIRFHLGTDRLFDLDVPPAPADPLRPYPNCVALPQWRTEAILRDRLAELGGAVEFDTGLEHFTADADGVTAALGGVGAGEVRARYLVGADGGRSTVRRRLGLEFSGTTAEDTRALLGDVRIDGLDPAAGVNLWMGTDGHLLVARPVPHTDQWQLVASAEPDAQGRWPEPSIATLQTALTSRSGDTGLRITDATWTSMWRYNLRMTDTYRVGPVFLVGDAAHVHSPFGGHGMNTGIQDAANLGWKLALAVNGIAGDALLDTYAAERVPVARAVLADSDQRFKSAAPPRLVRPLLAMVLKTFFTRAQRRDRTDHPTYRTGPLSDHQAPRRTRLHAGDPAPDAPLTIAGRPARLFDLLRGPHFTLLNLGVPGAAPAGALQSQILAYTIVPETSPHAGERDTVVDHTGLLQRVFARTASVLIRPDGYIGLTTSTTDPAPLNEYARHLNIRTASNG